MSGSSKSFETIHDDYHFFEMHSSEAESDLAVYRATVDGLRLAALPLPHFLDFGCGAGTFSERFLATCGFLPGKTKVALVEVDELYRRNAAERLAPWSAEPIAHAGSLAQLRDANGEGGRSFDLVVANHVFYYVIDLKSNLEAIHQSLTPGGAFLATMAGTDNALIEIWLAAFRLLALPLPYHTSEAFGDALTASGIPFETQRAAYELVFPDTAENRRKILRFLLNHYLDRIPEDVALSYLDRFAVQGRIEIATGHDHYLVRAPRG